MNITKAKLGQALMFGYSINLPTIRFAKVTAIEHEDGSGKRFTVTGYTNDGKKATVFCETID